jgi:hypothetical protein
MMPSRWMQTSTILVQKIVKGIELNLVGVGDGNGGHLGLVAIKKMGVTELGKIWSGVTIDDDDVVPINHHWESIVN